MDKAVIARKDGRIIITRCIPEAVGYIEQVMDGVRDEGVDVDKIMQIRDWKEVEAFMKGKVVHKLECSDKQPGKKKAASVKPAGKSKGKTSAVRKVLEGVSKQGAITGKQVASEAGLTSSEVSEPLIRLTKTGKIGRISGTPHLYFDLKCADGKKRHIPEVGEHIRCAMRFDKNISKDECNPNPSAKGCRSCPWGKDAAA